MTRTPIPSAVFDKALTARNAAARLSVTLTNSATWEGLCQAEVDRRRLMDAARDLGANIRTLKAQCRADEIKARHDREIVARDRKAVENV